MLWRVIQISCNNESPMVVVLSGSMEPGMFRGDILVLQHWSEIDIGDIIVYKLKTDPIPIVHRISSIQEVIDRDVNGKPKMLNGKPKMTRKFLSKGDNNPVDDRGLYPRG